MIQQIENLFWFAYGLRLFRVDIEKLCKSTVQGRAAFLDHVSWAGPHTYKFKESNNWLWLARQLRDGPLLSSLVYSVSHGAPRHDLLSELQEKKKANGSATVVWRDLSYQGGN